MLDLSSRRTHSLADAVRGRRDVPQGNLVVLPDAAKFIVRGRPPAIAAIGSAFGVALPAEACRFASSVRRTAFWLGPDEWMLQAVGEDPTPLFKTLDAAASDHARSIVDVSHRSDAFAVQGPRSQYLLNHGCPLDLSHEAFPIGMCTRTVFAKAAILLSRPERDTFHIDVWRSFAPYVWQLLEEARSEFA